MRKDVSSIWSAVPLKISPRSSIFFGRRRSRWRPNKHLWLVVSTHLKNISEIGNLPQKGVKIKNIWNHHLDLQSVVILTCFPKKKIQKIFSQNGDWKMVMYPMVQSKEITNKNKSKHATPPTSYLMDMFRHPSVDPYSNHISFKQPASNKKITILPTWQDDENPRHPVAILQSYHHTWCFKVWVFGTRWQSRALKRRCNFGDSYTHSPSSWWLNQPLWKNMLVKMGSSSPNFEVKITKNIWVATT